MKKKCIFKEKLGYHVSDNSGFCCKEDEKQTIRKVTVQNIEYYLHSTPDVIDAQKAEEIYELLEEKGLI